MTKPAAKTYFGPRPTRGRRGEHTKNTGRKGGFNSDQAKEPGTKLGERLRQLRVNQDMNQKDLALCLGFKNGVNNRISEWELGHHLPTLTTLQDYALVFDTTVADILDGVM